MEFLPGTEFKGKLDGLGANGGVRLRFSGLWTGAKDGKQMPFSLRELRFDFGGLKLDQKKGIPSVSGRDAGRYPQEARGSSQDLPPKGHSYRK